MTTPNSLPAAESDSNVIHLPFDIQIQHAILKLMLTSENFLLKSSLFLQEELFENIYLGWFFKLMIDHYLKFGTVIEPLTVKNEILKFPIEQRILYETVYERITTSDYRDEQYIREELTGWIRSRKFIRLHKDMEKLYRANQKESAYDVTEKAINELRQIDFLKDDTIDFAHIENLIDQCAQSQGRRIPTGIGEIDKALRGGLPSGTLTTILGVTNSGKSVMLLNLVYHAIIHNKKVLYIFHEGQTDQVMNRILARFTGIPYGRFLNGWCNLNSDEQRRIKIIKDILAENLQVRPWLSFGVTIEDLISTAKFKKKEFDYDMLVDDYGQLLFTKNATKELRHNQAIVYRGLASLAADLNVSVLTAVQGNRSSFLDMKKHSDKLIDMGDIAECFEIARCSETVLTLTRSPEDAINNRVRILLEKQRDGMVNVGVECVTNMEKLIMYDEKLGIKSLRLNEQHEVLDDESI